MSDNNRYIIRNINKAEVAQILIKWAANEGWNPGINDATCFFNTDKKGFFAGFLNNEPISCISAVSYNNKFGFIGFYIVKPEYRGKGFGIKIWDKALEYLNNQNIGLDGVVEQQMNYMKSGFKYAYGNIRYEGNAFAINQSIPDIHSISDIPFNDIIDYDSKLFPSPRPEFLKNWLNQPNGKTFIAIKNGNISGYSVIRKCLSGYKIGPLFADNENIANSLFLSAVNFLKTETKFYLDIPEINTIAVKIAEKYKLKPVFKTARMYTISIPDIDINKVYGISSFELG